MIEPFSFLGFAAAAVNRAICRLGSLDNLFRVHFKLDFQFGQFNFESNMVKLIKLGMFLPELLFCCDNCCF